MLFPLLISAAAFSEPAPTLDAFGLPAGFRLPGLGAASADGAGPPWARRFLVQRTLGQDGYFPGLDDRGVACVLDPGMAIESPSVTMHTYGSLDLELGTRVLSSALMSFLAEVVELPTPPEPPGFEAVMAAQERATNREVLRGRSQELLEGLRPRGARGRR
jgi:hypothetical protein